jgi:hypothetical protein
MASLADMPEGMVCLRCGRENTYVVRTIEHTERVGPDTVAVVVEIGVCANCDERPLDSAATRKIQEAVRELKAGATADLDRTGSAYVCA